MRKIMAIGVALCIFAMFVSTASACTPAEALQGKCVLPTQQDIKPMPAMGTFSAIGTAATNGIASAGGLCPVSQVVTTTGVTGSSITSSTNAAANGWDAQTGAIGGSQAAFTFSGVTAGR